MQHLITHDEYNSLLARIQSLERDAVGRSAIQLETCRRMDEIMSRFGIIDPTARSINRMWGYALKIVSRNFGVETPMILSANRTHSVAMARHAAEWLCHRHGLATLGTIAEAVGRHYSSIRHSIKVIENECATNPGFASKIMGMVQQFLGLLESQPNQPDLGLSVSNEPSDSDGCLADPEIASVTQPDSQCVTAESAN